MSKPRTYQTEAIIIKKTKLGEAKVLISQRAAVGEASVPIFTSDTDYLSAAS